MSLLFGFKRFSVVHTCIITFDWVKVKYFDNARTAVCGVFWECEYFGKAVTLAIDDYTTARLTAEGPLGPFSSSNITASPSFSVSMPAA